MANEVLPIAELLKPYEGQEVFVGVEVVQLDPKTNEPLTGRPCRIPLRPIACCLRGCQCAHRDLTEAGSFRRFVCPNPRRLPKVADGFAH